jgi:hypothetical protein
MTKEYKTMNNSQKLRLRRFGMAMATYAIVILAIILITRLGLGEMNTAQWATFLGLPLIANALFFYLFYTNANLRFSDPSLTREQIVCSSLWGMIALYALPEARPIVLMFFLPAFSFGILRLTGRQYLGVALLVMGSYGTILCLEYFLGRKEFNIQYELFLFVIFSLLLIWFASFGAYVSNIRRRMRARNKEIQKAHEEIRIEIEARKRGQIERENLIIELKDALKKVKMLKGLFPICASCKKIRDDKGYWNQIESYIRDHSEAKFSHGICPECAEKLYPDLKLYRKKDK